MKGIRSEAITDALASAGHTLNKGDDIILPVVNGKAVGVLPYSGAGLFEAGRLPEVTLEVYRTEGTGANGEVLRFRNVTKDYAPQIAEVEAENAAVAAGKEGVGGEYIIIQHDIGDLGKDNNYIIPDNSKAYDYRRIFFDRNPELEGKVIVHHSIEQQVLRNYPGLFTELEINQYERLRGIPIGINDYLHLSRIRKEWNQFYKDLKKGKIVLSQQSFLERAKQIDHLYGDLFFPPIK